MGGEPAALLRGASASPLSIAASQRAILDAYYAVALTYCAASSVLYHWIAMTGLAWVHIISFVILAVNYVVLRRTDDLVRASHVILAVGTLVVSSLLITGGWQQTGYLWTFAYLPYALFLAPPRISWTWIGLLVVVDAFLLAVAAAGPLPMPYTGVQLGFFAASLGIFLLVMWFFQDATLGAEKRAEATAAEAAEARDRLAEAQRLARIGSWTWHIPTDTVAWSDELHRLLGVTRGSVQPSFDEYLSRVHPDDHEALQATFRRAFESGQPFAAEHRVAGERPEAWIGSTGRIIETGPDGPVRWAGTAQDITDRKRADAEERRVQRQQVELEALHAANQLKTAFLNTAAHELSTPLTPVKIQMRLLLHRTEGQHPDLHHGMEVLARNLGRLEVLVRDLLDGARLQSDHLRLTLEDVDLTDLVRQSIATHDEMAKEGHVDIAADLPDALPVRADATRIAQVLDNLLGNALKFTRAGGHVVVRARQDGARAVVTVEDDGIGFTAESAARLFQPFAQVHDPSKHMAGGTGLGLYICRGIAEAHGGTIQARSEGPGRGASFTLELPVGGPPGPVRSGPLRVPLRDGPVQELAAVEAEPGPELPREGSAARVAGSAGAGGPEDPQRPGQHQEHGGEGERHAQEDGVRLQPLECTPQQERAAGEGQEGQRQNHGDRSHNATS